MRRSSTWWSVALGGALLTSRLALAQPVIDIPHPMPVPDGHFGGHVAELGGDVLVAAGRSLFSSEGEVYLLDAATGALMQTFVNPDPMLYEFFGVSLASAAGKALIGAYGDSGFVFVSGAAFLFDAGSGALVRTFSSPAGPDALFGASVAALGSNVLVGAPGYSIAGAVYLFDGATGALLRTFQAPVPASEDKFGFSIAALGGNVLVGAPGIGSSPGAAYLFDGATGALLQTFVDPSPPGGDPAFGFAVAAAGGNALVTDPRDDGAGTDEGAAHLFDAVNGMVIRSFSPPTLGLGFGASLAVSGTHALFGSALVGFVFDITSGALERTLRDPTPGPGSGSAVTFADGHPVLTNPQDEFPTVRSGSVYVFCGGATGCGPCETCGPAGTCVVAPHPSCDTALTGKTRLRIVNRPTSDGGDVVSWSALGDFGTPLGPEQEIFGLPTDATLQHDYTLCLYDESGPTPSLLFRATAPAGDTCGSGPCWEERESCGARSCGVKYKDGEFSPEGVQKLVATQRTLLKFLGRGENLSNRPGGLPALPLPLPLRAQLQIREGGICWEAEYTAATANSSQLFRARTD